MLTFAIGFGAQEVIFLLLILLIVLLVSAFIELIKSELQSTEKILWGLFILLMPVIGPVVFLIYNGARKK